MVHEIRTASIFTDRRCLALTDMLSGGNILCDISQPGFLEVMSQDERHLCVLIKAEEDVNHHRWQLKDEGQYEAYGHEHTPHVDNIA